MKKLNADSKKNIGIRRLFNNLLHSISKSAMISSKIRVFIHSLRGVKFENMNTVFIGEDVIIDKMNPQNVKIGDRCLIAAGVKIFTHYVDTKNLSNHESYHFRFYDGNVIIEEDVFIGANAVIAKPVKIGKGSIIGANSVVNKSTEEYSINVGAPSIKIINRY